MEGIIKKRSERYASLEDGESIRKLRETLGLEPLSEQEVQCSFLIEFGHGRHFQRCEKRFLSQFAGKRKVEHFCPRHSNAGYSFGG